MELVAELAAVLPCPTTPLTKDRRCAGSLSQYVITAVTSLRSGANTLIMASLRLSISLVQLESLRSKSTPYSRSSSCVSRSEISRSGRGRSGETGRVEVRRLFSWFVVAVGIIQLPQVGQILKNCRLQAKINIDSTYNELLMV